MHAGTARRRLKNILGGSLGNLVEWFDWYVYSAFGLYFASAFFAEGDQTAQLLQTAAIFAVGFVMRPVGAWAMGIYADHKGRKAGLTLSVSLMCFGSLLIAFAPTYAQVGLASPAILLVARVIQGLSLASLGFGLFRPGFTSGASLAVGPDEQNEVAGQVTSVNGVAFVAGPAAGVGLYMMSLALPFLVTAVLMLVLAIWTWLRFSPSAPAE